MWKALEAVKGVDIVNLLYTTPTNFIEIEC